MTQICVRGLGHHWFRYQVTARTDAYLLCKTPQDFLWNCFNFHHFQNVFENVVCKLWAILFGLYLLTMLVPVLCIVYIYLVTAIIASDYCILTLEQMDLFFLIVFFFFKILLSNDVFRNFIFFIFLLWICDIIINIKAALCYISSHSADCTPMYFHLFMY